MKSAVLLFLISGGILFADTTPAEVTYSNPTFLQAGPAPFVIVGADTSMIQQVGTMYGELNYMQPFTVSSAAYYTIDASVSAFYSAGECSPIGFCTASVTDQLAASFYFSGGPAMTIADTKTSSAPWAMLTASGDQSETFFLDPGSYVIYGQVQASGISGEQGVMVLTTNLTVTDPPAPTPEPGLAGLLALSVLGTALAARRIRKSA